MRSLLIIFALTCLAAIGSCDVIASTKLEKAVGKALAEDDRTKEFSFEISHEGEGKILITGEVYNAPQIDAVKEVAAAVEGVSSVVAKIGLEDHSDSGLMQDGVLNTPYF